MKPPEESFARGNPFSTRHVRPGAIAFVFPADVSGETLVDRLRANDWCGEIIGPHGTGKSTLLAEMTPHLENQGRRVISVTLRENQRRLPDGVLSMIRRRDDQLIIDGYEQLGWSARRQLQGVRRRYGAGLLVTSHRPTGWPEIWHTSADAALARQIIRRLELDARFRVADEALHALLEMHTGNMREVLFDLYDAYERWRSERKT